MTYLLDYDCCSHCWERGKAVELESYIEDGWDIIFCPSCEYSEKEKVLTPHVND